ncbi:MAG: glycosyltransferase, partial [Candidatus Omnitrophota bacterium]
FYLKGGSEYVFFDSAEYLGQKGHKPIFFSMRHPENLPSVYDKYFVSNVDYDRGGLGGRISSSLKILYSLEARRKVEELINRETPDIAHLHNIYHQISPSILHSLKKFNIPVVLTLHDYKMVCPSHTLLCRGKACEACGGGRYYNCFLKGCTGDSRLKNLLNAAEMYLHHSILRIYDLVDVFISPSVFLKNKLEEMGFRGKIVYLPNSIKSGGIVPEYKHGERSIIYFGRLSGEKGLFTLVEAVKGMRGITLKIAGEGPVEKDIRAKVSAEKIGNVIFLGYRGWRELRDEIARSMFVVLPSEWYENNPRSIIEGFACGKPVVGSRIGGIPELIRDGETGLTFEPGDPEDLRVKIEGLVNDPARIAEMGKKARMFVEREFDSDGIYKRLMVIYNQAIMGHEGR